MGVQDQEVREREGIVVTRRQRALRKNGETGEWPCRGSAFFIVFIFTAVYAILGVQVSGLGCKVKRGEGFQVTAKGQVISIYCMVRSMDHRTDRPSD